MSPLFERKRLRTQGVFPKKRDESGTDALERMGSFLRTGKRRQPLCAGTHGVFVENNVAESADTSRPRRPTHVVLPENLLKPMHQRQAWGLA